MHSPFTPVPNWLNSEQRSIEDPLRFPSPDSVEFLLVCFEVLYGLGMSDRQVVHLTALLICLARTRMFHLPLTEGVPCSSRWYSRGSKFFLCCSSLREKVWNWVELFVSKSDLRSAPSQAFWADSDNWYEFFFQDTKKLKEEIHKTRNRFAQQFFGLDDTGIWNAKTFEATKRFQAGFPRSLLPWKNGTLDRFTYRLLARSWRKRKGILD